MSEESKPKSANLKDKVKELAENEKVQQGKEMASKKFNEARESMRQDFKDGGIKKLFKNKYFIGLSVAVVILLVFFSCGGSGPPAEIKDAIINRATTTTHNKVLDYEITNQFTEEKEGKTIYIYDFSVVVSTEDGQDLGAFAGKMKRSGRIACWKEGQKWAYEIEMR
jgi:hypothetical protein